MKKRITLDFETRSECDLKKSGAYLYSLHPTTRPTCLSFKVHGSSKITLLDFYTIDKPWKSYSEEFRSDWKTYIDQGFEFSCHNAFFETCIYKNILVKRYGWPDIPFEQFRCTAAKAAACALPRNLDGAGAAMDLPIQKDRRGYVAMMLTCKPSKLWNSWVKARADFKAGKRLGKKRLQLAMQPEPPKFLDPKSSPEVFRILYQYCKIDTQAEELLDDSLPDLIPIEQEIWFLNQKLNWRGLRIDIPTVKKIVDIMETESKQKLGELDELTMGLVTKPHARQSILDFLALEGIELPNVQAKTIEDVLKAGKLGPDMKRLLEIKQALSKTSTKKYQSFLDRSGEDHRVRDILLYHGASTGRDTGTGIQPHNFPRGAIRVDPSRPYAAVETVMKASPEVLKLLYDESLPIVFSSILRNMIIPSEGHELFVADFSKIEVAVLWWLADNKPGLKILREGKDPYIYQASANTGKSYEAIERAITAEEKWAIDARQLGKAQVLGCLARGTPTLTSSGFKPIESITDEDRLWDGERWVRHGGLVPKGLKTVIPIEIGNIESTPDHWFHQNGMWQTAVEIALSAGTLRLKSGNKMAMPLSFRKSLEEAPNAVSQSAAYAELKKNFESISSGEVSSFYARVVRNLLTDNAVEHREVEISSLIQNLDAVGQVVSEILNVDVETIIRKTSNGTAVAGLNVSSRVSANFWNTLLRCAGLIGGGYRWTELITTGTMKPEIYESLVSQLTGRTEETFDIKDLGDHHRFQVGPVLTHNCGFGMGRDKFLKTAYDQYRLKLTQEQSFFAVKNYREKNEAVPHLWKDYERAAILAIEEKKTVRVGKCKFFCKDDFLWIQLPSGRRLAYRNPTIGWRESEWGSQKTIQFWAVNSKTKKWSEERTWGGTLTENIVQAVARDLMMPAMVRLERANYQALLMVHDEGLCQRKKGKGSLEEFISILCERPEWADENLQIDAKGWIGPRYRK